MKSKKRISNLIFLLIFITGVVLSLYFNMLSIYTDFEGMSFWGYPEVTRFDPNLPSEGKIKNFHCPMILNKDEIGQISAQIVNISDKDIEPIIQANISKPGMDEDMVRESVSLDIPANGSELLSWSVGSENVLRDRTIFIRLYFYNSVYYPPSETKHCGIVVTDILNLPGRQIVLLIIILQAFLMTLGLYFIKKGLGKIVFTKRDPIPLLLWIEGILLTMTFSNLFGLWVIGVFLLIVIILLIVSIIESFFTADVT